MNQSRLGPTPPLLGVMRAFTLLTVQAASFRRGADAKPQRPLVLLHQRDAATEEGSRSEFSFAPSVYPRLDPGQCRRVVRLRGIRLT